MVGGLAGHSLLGLWERADGLAPVERALAMAGEAGADPDLLRERPLGQTHGSLLGLRQDLLGPDLAATASCPGCGERVEFSLDVADLLALRDDAVEEPAAVGEHHVRVRAPTPADVVAAADAPDPVAALAGRCLATPEGSPVEPSGISAGELVKAEAAMAAADPLAEILVDLACPSCGTTFVADLDVAGFVWAEVDAAARRLLVEVDQLARAYGWTEPEVLALSENRRAAYLRLVGEGGP